MYLHSNMVILGIHVSFQGMKLYFFRQKHLGDLPCATFESQDDPKMMSPGSTCCCSEALVQRVFQPVRGAKVGKTRNGSMKRWGWRLHSLFTEAALRESNIAMEKSHHLWMYFLLEKKDDFHCYLRENRSVDLWKSKGLLNPPITPKEKPGRNGIFENLLFIRWKLEVT